MNLYNLQKEINHHKDEIENLKKQVIRAFEHMCQNYARKGFKISVTEQDGPYADGLVVFKVEPLSAGILHDVKEGYQMALQMGVKIEDCVFAPRKPAFVFKVRETEHERGWGQRDDIVEFDSYEEAVEYIEKINSQNNKEIVPDCYFTAAPANFTIDDK